MSYAPEIEDELARLGEDPLPGEVSDGDIVAGALAGLAAPSFLVDGATASARAPIVLEPTTTSRPVVVALVAAVALGAAAALVVLVGVPSLDEWRQQDRAHGSLAPDMRDDGGDLREASERVPVEEPRARRRGSIADTPDPVGPEVVPELVLEEGTSGEPVEDETGDTLAADTGTDADATARRRAPTLPKSADALLSHAQEQLRDGKTRAAMRTYKRLVDRYPSSREAKAALVSMGRIALQSGHAKQALGHFDAYLAASAGPLVEEARYGRIRALRKLGRDTQELRSIDAFLADHGESIYAPRLKKRAEELRAE